MLRSYTISSWVVWENVPGSMVCMLLEEAYLEKDTRLVCAPLHIYTSAYSCCREVKFAKSSTESEVRPFWLIRLCVEWPHTKDSYIAEVYLELVLQNFHYLTVSSRYGWEFIQAEGCTGYGVSVTSKARTLSVHHPDTGTRKQENRNKHHYWAPPLLSAVFTACGRAEGQRSSLRHNGDRCSAAS